MRRYKPERRPTCVQLDYMEAELRFLARGTVFDTNLLSHAQARELAEAHVERGFDGSFVHATWPQIARGVGFPVMGLGAQQIKDRYGSRVERTMAYLTRAGLVDGWDPVYEGREPVGILVRLPAGVAQLVRAAES